MKVCVLSGCVAAILLIGAAPASAGHTLTGSCTYTGVVTWPNEPLRFVPAVIDEELQLSFLCTGTWGSHVLNDDPLTGVGHVRGLLSCAGGSGSSGTGTISWKNQRLHFNFTGDLFAGGHAVTVVTGEDGGSAVVNTELAPGTDTAAVTAACLGDGLRSANIVGTVQTTPSISG